MPQLEESVDTITIRRVQPTDHVSEITALLHKAYRPQVRMGLSPLAGRQDDGITAKRIASGECYLALLGESPTDNPGPDSHSPDSPTPTIHTPPAPRIVGTILFHEVEAAEGPPWFQQPDVDSFSQFGVDPGVQGRGVGRMLLDLVERRALECGARELGLSMAEPDTALRAFYERRGYRFIEHWQWPYTNYRSLILSKTLRTEDAD